MAWNTHNIMRARRPGRCVESTPPFDRQHAEREVKHLSDQVKEVTWADPSGTAFKVSVLPTVYPPREDTNLVARVLGQIFPRPGSTWLEIGCGSGALSLYAARSGCLVTACDINPFAVAATRHLLGSNGLRGEVKEGGPGPSADGHLAQWGGDRLYDTVVWNLPYLPSPEAQTPHLGPMEEAGLIDTDRMGLYDRFLSMVENGRLLHAKGTAFLVVSSTHVGETACERAWSKGLAARVVAVQTFSDGERLSVVQIWRPYTDAQGRVVESVASTNTSLLNMDVPVGSSLRAVHQSEGRGQRGRTWSSVEGAFLASWKLSTSPSSLSATRGQVRIGAAMARLFRHLGGTGDSSNICMKWPNDLYIRKDVHGWKKGGGVLMEGATRGRDTSVVVGVGLNLGVPHDSDFAGLWSLGLQPSLDELFLMMNAVVASVFEDHALAQCPEEHEAVEAEVRRGESHLGPIFYRNERYAIHALKSTGELVFEGGVVADDGNLLEWSNL